MSTRVEYNLKLYYLIYTIYSRVISVIKGSASCFSFVSQSQDAYWK